MFKGGFLSGKKAYIMAVIIALNGFVDWALHGQLDLAGFITLLGTDPHIQAAASLVAVRLGISKMIQPAPAAAVEDAPTNKSRSGP